MARSDIRPLRTAEDHAWALAEIDKVLDASPASPEGDRFELLSAFIDAYEAEHHPIHPQERTSARLIPADASIEWGMAHADIGLDELEQVNGGVQDLVREGRR